VRRQGEATQDVVDRLDRLQRQRDDFAAAGSFGRLLVLIREVDPGLARATYLDFEPAMPATSEGAVTGGIGFVLFWGLLLFLARIVRRLRPRFRTRREVVRSA
jgi:hypothetical protein